MLNLDRTQARPEPTGVSKGVAPNSLRQACQIKDMEAEPEETLVADLRASLTPSQMVDRKLAALLGAGRGRRFGEAGRAQDARRGSDLAPE